MPASLVGDRPFPWTLLVNSITLGSEHGLQNQLNADGPSRERQFGKTGLAVVIYKFAAPVASAQCVFAAGKAEREARTR
jgi:hypothetical protein